MPSNRIPGERVALTDVRTGIADKSWYRFLSDLFQVTGAGATVPSMVTMADDIAALQIEPPVTPAPYAAVVGRVAQTLDFPSTAANSSSNLTITVPGAVDGDVVSLAVPAASVPTNGGYFAWVSAANTVTVRFMNNTTAAIDPVSGVFRVAVTRG